MVRRRLIVGISGASGAIYGIRLLEILKAVPDVETHLVVSASGHITLAQETDFSFSDVKEMADVFYNEKDIGATLSSGSFLTEGMIIAPCSMKTLSGVVHSFSDNLVVRAADVVLKERRRLVLMTRETPLHTGHLSLMHQASQMGAIIAPPMPAFYTKPQSIVDLVNHNVLRILDLFDIHVDYTKRWSGLTA